MSLYLKMFKYEEMFSFHNLIRLEGMDYDTNVFKMPKIFKYAIDLMFKYKTLTYSDFSGFPRLKDEIKLHEKLISGIDRPSAVFVSQGASGIIDSIIKIIKNYHNKRNPKIIMFTPEYSFFYSIIVANNIKPVIVKSKRSNNYLVKIQDIKDVIDDDVIGIIFSNPNNPTGQVYAKDWISKLIILCKQKKISIVVDEIYRNTIYNGKHIFLEEFNGGFDNLFKIFSLSKDRPGFTGIRSGYCIFDITFKKEMQKHQIVKNFSNTIFSDFLLLIDISMRNYLLTGKKSKDLEYFQEKYLIEYKDTIHDFYNKQEKINKEIILELQKNKNIIDIIHPHAGNSIWFKYYNSLPPEEFVRTFIRKGLAIYASDVFMGDYKANGAWSRLCVTKHESLLKKGISKI